MNHLVRIQTLSTFYITLFKWSSFTILRRIASEGFRERPRPRKPEYLRESFDFNQVSIATNVSPRVSSTRATKQEEDDETKPRSSPPRPSYQMRSNIHPHQRNPREESIVFPSSSGDESFPGSKQARETVGKMQNLLMIMLLSRAAVSQLGSAEWSGWVVYGRFYLRDHH